MCGSMCLVVHWGIIFGAVIGYIINTRSTIVTELALRVPTMETVEVHVHGLGVLVKIVLFVTPAVV